MMGLLFAGLILVKEFKENGEAAAVFENDSQRVSAKEEQGGEEVILEEEAPLFVLDVQGAVLTPGIVFLPEGSRVYEALEKAGGVLENADTKYINQAEYIADGMIIYVPWKEGEQEGLLYGEAEGKQGGASSSQGDKININSASREELMSLPGIGESLAGAIIRYRQENGFFQNIQQLMEVGGIAEKKFEQIRELVSTY